MWLIRKKNKYHIKGCASIWDFDQDRTSDSLKKSEVLKEGIYHPCGICDLGIKEWKAGFIPVR